MSQIFRLSCILNDLYSICVTYLIHVWWLAISVITACAVQWIIVTLHNMNIHVVLEYLCCFGAMLQGAAACQLYYCYCYYLSNALAALNRLQSVCVSLIVSNELNAVQTVEFNRSSPNLVRL